MTKPSISNGFANKRKLLDSIACPGCDRLLSPNLFHVNRHRYNGKHRLCRDCRTKECREQRDDEYRRKVNLRNKLRRKTDTEYVKQCRLRHKKWYLKKLGLTLEDYWKALADQEGKCAICGLPEEQNLHGILYVDHDHRTGEFRGLLCKHCNSGLGHFRDSLKLIKRAWKYLKCE